MLSAFDRTGDRASSFGRCCGPVSAECAGPSVAQLLNVYPSVGHGGLLSIGQAPDRVGARRYRHRDGLGVILEFGNLADHGARGGLDLQTMRHVGGNSERDGHCSGFGREDFRRRRRSRCLERDVLSPAGTRASGSH